MKETKNKKTFLKKLNSMLNEEKNKEYISWYKSTNKIIIKEIDEFSENILHKYFNHKNFSSFVRQLNSYNFQKEKNNKSDKNLKYENPDFHRNMSDKEIENLETKIFEDKKNRNKRVQNNYINNDVIKEPIIDNYNEFKNDLNMSLDEIKKLKERLDNLNNEIENLKNKIVEKPKPMFIDFKNENDKKYFDFLQNKSINSSGISLNNNNNALNDSYIYPYPLDKQNFNGDYFNNNNQKYNNTMTTSKIFEKDILKQNYH